MSDSGDSDSDSDTFDDGKGIIVPIQQQDVQRIVAGQVISDLASTVKELVDNALDSGSKSVNIRLFDQGLDKIEVSDFGCGVPRDSRYLLAMKHATSKIRSFDDIYADKQDDGGEMQMQQLGFRGEALFSLANISQQLVVSTRTENEGIGQSMAFRRDGYPDLSATTDVARKVGTTVAVVKLFGALPVRRADLIKRIKFHRAKMLRLLQAYAVLCVGIRFNLSDVSGPVGSKKHKTEVMMNTSQNSKTLRETVSQVFGSKFVAGLNSVRVDLTPVLSSSKDKIEVSKTGTQNQDWRIEGLISKAPSTEASGKAAREIQFFSINGRPVDLPKVSHVISDAWRNFESVSAESSKKRPACILRFFLPNSNFDINVAPDKREVLLTDATLVYDALRDALITLWSEQTEGVFLANEAEFMSNESKQKKISSSINEMKRHPESSSCITDDKIIDTPPIKRQKMQRRNAFVNYLGNNRDSSESTQNNFFDHFAKIERLRKSLPTEMVDKNLVGTMQQDTSESERVECLSAETKGEEIPVDTEIPRVAVLTAASSENDKWKQSKLQFSPAKSDTQRQEIEILESMECQNNGTRSLSKERNSIKTSISKEVVSSLPLGRLEGHAASQISKKVTPSSILSPQTTSTPDSYHGSTSIEGNIRGEETGSFPTTPPRKPKITKNCTSGDDSSDSESLIGDETTEPISDCNEVQNQTASIAWSGFSTVSILQEFQASNRFARDRNKHLSQLKSNRARSRQTGEYEEEVESTSKKLSLSKDDFIAMKVIGQFNLGFIIALGDDGQLWILDQHGCDEKYNFEKLCKETKIHEQKLIAHLPLELSPSEENCVLENLEIFEKNGFRFSHDPSKPPRHRLSLTAVPHSGSGGDGRKAVQFGSQDVGALCAMLGADGASSSSGYVAGSGTGADGAGKSGNNAVRRHAGINSATIRLPKAVAMFASRACRSSIMIGDSLSQGKMEEVVKKMNKLDHPWECAHGRPTIRHVRDLLEQSMNDENI